MRYHFIVNPVAGRGRVTTILDDVQTMLREHGFEVSRYVTKAAGDAGVHVATLGPDEVDRVVVVGGDGTLREVVNGMPPPLPWPIGIVPVGTANLV
ncbi:MAG: diacylglycerol kinase family protein, partial [Planctomycetota bacterium]|nr:diacylglycerol kinase family protein [Planctomycetota bacterium]